MQSGKPVVDHPWCRGCGAVFPPNNKIGEGMCRDWLDCKFRWYPVSPKQYRDSKNTPWENDPYGLNDKLKLKQK